MTVCPHCGRPLTRPLPVDPCINARKTPPHAPPPGTYDLEPQLRAARVWHEATAPRPIVEIQVAILGRWHRFLLRGTTFKPSRTRRLRMYGYHFYGLRLGPVGHTDQVWRLVAYQTRRAQEHDRRLRVIR